MPAAINWLDRALEIDPDNIDAAFSKSLPNFMLDDRKAGFAAAELRFEKSDPVTRLYHGKEPAWDGQRLGVGDLLVLHAEQGLGDSIMMVRFLALIEIPRDQVVVLVPSTLTGLFANAFPGWSFQPLEPNFKGWRGATVRCSLMSLPHVLASQWDVPPLSNGYLSASEHIVQKWGASIGEASGPRIGLVWRGSPSHRSDHLRSIDLDTFLSALVPGPITWCFRRMRPRQNGASWHRDPICMSVSTRLTILKTLRASPCILMSWSVSIQVLFISAAHLA